MLFSPLDMPPDLETQPTGPARYSLDAMIRAHGASAKRAHSLELSILKHLARQQERGNDPL
jgi:hypothetical protein